jgi:hypothetical protein
LSASATNGSAGGNGGAGANGRVRVFW